MSARCHRAGEAIREVSLTIRENRKYLNELILLRQKLEKVEKFIPKRIEDLHYLRVISRDKV